MRGFARGLTAPVSFSTVELELPQIKSVQIRKFSAPSNSEVDGLQRDWVNVYASIAGAMERYGRENPTASREHSDKRDLATGSRTRGRRREGLAKEAA